MKYRPALYIPLAVVAAVSFLGALLLPISDVAKTLTGLPFVGALFAALFQLIRDHSSFVKETERQRREHAFAVAATSHMSKVVFDKHVEFGEAYIAKLQELLGSLFAEGPTKKAIEYVRPLYDVRRNYRLWVSPSMATTLDEFEGKIVKMGASYGLWEAMQYEKGSNGKLDLAYELFNEIMELRRKNSDDPEIEIKKHQGYNYVIEHFQRILGVEKLTELRDSIISHSYGNDSKT